MLFDKIADPNFPYYQMDIAARSVSYEKILGYRNEQGFNILQHAAYHNNHEAIYIIWRHFNWEHLSGQKVSGHEDFAGCTALEIAEKKKFEQSEKGIKDHDKLESNLKPIHKMVRAKEIHKIEEICNQDRTAIGDATDDDIQLKPLHIAAGIGFLEAVVLLLKLGADINAVTAFGETALRRASRMGYEDVVKYLVTRNNCDLNRAAKDCYTSLEIASLHNFGGVVRALAENGAQVTPNALCCAASEGHLSLLENMICECGADPKGVNKHGKNCFHCAASNGKIDVLNKLFQIDPSLIETRTLLNEGVRVYLVRGKDKNKPAWHYVLVKRRLHSTFLLKTQGASLDVSKYGRVLVSGRGEGPPEDIKTKINEEHSTIWEDAQKDMSPLHCAVMEEQLIAVQKLVELGANVDARDAYKLTPLHLACMRGNVSIVKELLKANANFQVLDEDRKSPSDVARDNNHKEIVELLAKNESAGLVERFILDQLKTLQMLLEKTDDDSISSRDFQKQLINEVQTLKDNTTLYLSDLAPKEVDSVEVSVQPPSVAPPDSPEAATPSTETSAAVPDGESADNNNITSISENEVEENENDSNVNRDENEVLAREVTTPRPNDRNSLNSFIGVAFTKCAMMEENSTVDTASMVEKDSSSREVEMLFDKIADPNFPYYQIDIAARSVSYEKVLQYRNKQGFNVLQHAAYNNNQEAIFTIWRHFDWKHLSGQKVSGHNDFTGCTALEIAMKKKCEQLEKRIKHHDKLESNLKPIHKMVRAREIHKIEEICSLDRTSIDDARDLQLTPLHMAAGIGFLEGVVLLLKLGADINAVTALGETALRRASRLGYEDVVKYLVTRNNCDLNKAAKDGYTSLEFASLHNFGGVVRALAENGAQVTPNALCCAASRGHLSLLDNMISKWGADPKGVNSKGKNCFHSAAGNGKIDILEKLFQIDPGLLETCTLLNEGDRVHLVRDKDKNKPVWRYVLVKRRLQSTFLLKTQGGSLDVADYGRVLVSGRGEGPPEDIKIKINEEHSTIWEDAQKDMSPLHCAIMEEQLTAVQKLVELGADVDARDAYKLTPLHLACMRGNVPIVKELLKANANFQVFDEDRKSPSDVARDNNHKEVAELLAKKESAVLVERFILDQLKTLQILLEKTDDDSISSRDFQKQLINEAQTLKDNVTLCLSDLAPKEVDSVEESVQPPSVAPPDSPEAASPSTETPAAVTDGESADGNHITGISENEVEEDENDSNVNRNENEVLAGQVTTPSPNGKSDRIIGDSLKRLLETYLQQQ
ncbi:serine/threonine-protein phosphatase 6 regulatory ankyrin repeat subunit B [Lingula anatina]|uniref:Serine/threonine-protein phosphatase 6 regulatory ankyrin repeat subunit B n=1 Tax=Lingula anatina TaxID=7574 RepID=A0A2R2MSK3_LINAN|nr:serine/threonine-protein phosphatase 6 regulatory ankyrin repeat subunit B [Lingula anatina]|eukprot:XP_023933241.1 serine/threonine-protein phosphatase 6 regulatory ankyrin repeat subunit B [Lingula anatina]